ncbi:hypothetical protein DSO57_1011943 [Entomophthora muscae]|uniref:Uncharacterized protein n=1 Tax=Entomophthora muscae TaxID=34485 RepID=A0ACC2U4D8_9FUNG|nr:hypothetical protein DSO57_1011943 [Entomophthora muscae]
MAQWWIVLESVIELLLIAAGIFCNGVLAWVTLGRSRSDADRDVILAMSVLDLVSGISQCALNAVSLMYNLFGVVVLRMDLLGLVLQTHASMILLPAALLGLILATLLGIARCALIVFGCNVTHIGTAAIVSSVTLMGLHTSSFLTFPSFYGVVFHADPRDPHERPIDWYTVLCLILLIACLLAITLSYSLLSRHYYHRKRLCDLRGKRLRAPIGSLIIVTIMYSVAILPRIITVFITQVFCQELIWQSHFISLSLLVFLPLINAAFSLFLHDESRILARRFFKRSS